MDSFRPGSSPLTRGKLLPVTPTHLHSRLIPAHAGKTDPGGRRQVGAGGSSPLTRGKRWVLSFVRSNMGLIPAHAGKTWPRGRRGPTRRAHPRSRGENSGSHRQEYSRTGSSPLTRGKHFPTCAFTAQIDQILETLELAVSSGSYSVWVACATDAPQDQVRSIGLVLPSSRGAS